MFVYFVYQSAFMNTKNQQLNTLQDIKQMMERSSRFISLSGWSGITAGTAALIGAFFAHNVIAKSDSSYTLRNANLPLYDRKITIQAFMGSKLLWIAILTFIAALIVAFLFTYLRSRKLQTTVWNKTSKRMIFNLAIPIIIGGIYLFKLIEAGSYGFIAPGCLLFYGLGLLNASKYTLGEIRYLAYCEIVLGIISLWFVGYGLYFWAIGFGVLHIIYGTIMWCKYERSSSEQ